MVHIDHWSNHPTEAGTGNASLAVDERGMHLHMLFNNFHLFAYRYLAILAVIRFKRRMVHGELSKYTN